VIMCCSSLFLLLLTGSDVLLGAVNVSTELLVLPDYATHDLKMLDLVFIVK